MFKKIVLAATLFAGICGFAVAGENDNWYKIIFAGPEFLFDHQKTVDFDDDDSTINSYGGGITVEYISANKQNGFAFILNESFGVIGTSDLTSDSEVGVFCNTYAGVGYAPLRTENFMLTVTGGIGIDFYNYRVDVGRRKDIGVSGLDFLVGADIALTWKVSRRVGIGFNLLGTVAVAGVEVIDFDVHDGPRDRRNDDVEKNFIKAGSFSLLPSIGVTVHF